MKKLQKNFKSSYNTVEVFAACDCGCGSQCNVHDKPDISYEENKIVHHLKFMIFWNFDREYYIKNGG